MSVAKSNTLRRLVRCRWCNRPSRNKPQPNEPWFCTECRVEANLKEMLLEMFQSPNSELQGFPRTEVIQCHQCGKTQSAQVHFERWMPFPVYVHDCECGYTITESDWDVVPNADLTGNQKPGKEVGL
jgi:hypothetical protein